MGLDNGFQSRDIKRSDIPDWVKLPFSEESDKYGGVEFAYFRKCWGLRNEILAVLHANDEYTVPVDAEDIIPIVRVIFKYLDKEYYNEYACSIWEYDEYVDIIKQSIINLMWLRTYMDANPEVRLWFYDSY